MIRNFKDFWTGLIYMFFGTSAVIIARDYGMGTALRMGPAYFPTVLGSLLVVIGVIAVVRSFLQSGSPVGGFTVKGMVLVVTSTLAFGLLVKGAGLVVALPVLVISSGYASQRFRWGTALGLAAGLTLFCVLVFLKGLGVPLPIWGSWFGG